MFFTLLYYVMISKTIYDCKIEFLLDPIDPGRA